MSPEPHSASSPLRRVVLTAAGCVCVALGVAGMVLPLVPATPFLLLAAWLFSRSSPRFHRWLLTNRFLGRYIENYRAGRGMARRDKVVTILTLWVTLGISATLVSRWWVSLLLLAVAVGVTIHLVRLRTARADTATLTPCRPRVKSS